MSSFVIKCTLTYESMRINICVSSASDYLLSESSLWEMADIILVDRSFVTDVNLIKINQPNQKISKLRSDHLPNHHWFGLYSTILMQILIVDLIKVVLNHRFQIIST